jgi:ATP-dependent helicase/nuclease subunit A
MTIQNTMQAPSDQDERLKAIDTGASVIVEAPAGSGKTTLLTQRFLKLLARVDDPRHIVAITFTNAAAAEMRHRILDALAKAAKNDAGADDLAVAAYARSQEKEWNLLEQPASLRISTIDSFCRDLAIQQPLLSGLGGSLTVAEHPEELYKKTAQQTMAQIDDGPEDLRDAISTLLFWRDNSWHELESELVRMLAKRDRWMQGFVFDAGVDDTVLRGSLERPFARAAAKAVNRASELLSEDEFAQIETLGLFACENLSGERYKGLTNGSNLAGPVSGDDMDGLEAALAAYRDLSDMLLTKEGKFRAKFTKNEGFPATAKEEKAQVEELVARLANIEGFGDILAGIGELPALKYGDDEWRIVRACFVLLRYAAAKLKIVFSEVGRCDFVEIAQLAQQALVSSEGAYTVADEIRHLLVDEFQDTSRRQHRLLADLVGHWPDRENRTAFFVGDPRQSIYFFRDAEAELFPRVQNMGLEISEGDALEFAQAKLSANFRTEPDLVDHLNGVFEKVFGVDDGSGLKHAQAVPARKGGSAGGPLCNLHMEFVPASAPFRRLTPEQIASAVDAETRQNHQVVELIRSFEPRITEARKEGKKFRIAVLGRTHKALLPIAEGLRSAEIPFRAIDLEPLAERPEVTDALGLARAFLNPEDRVAWLGVLRAPWCGLPLDELHLLTSADDQAVLNHAIPTAAQERLHLLSLDSQAAVRRVLNAASEAAYLRASQPTQSLGAWLESVWQMVGGAACVDSQGRANLDLLWSVLDSLQNGEQDLLGQALESALSTLKAQPDPHASSNYGVQLLTIHKSKGLEFEVVIVPELHAQGGGAKLNMLSWMERGLAEGDDSGDLTEFLIAPFSTKGVAGGSIKKWVDREIRDRERQEMRRLLYVAATRARDELHLFARPGYRLNSEDGSRVLANPSECLLATAWPALEEEVRKQFDALPETLPFTGGVEEDAPDGPAILRRLPASFSIPQSTLPRLTPEVAEERKSALYTRETGGTESRVRGLAVHSLLEQIALLRKESHSWDDIRAALPEKSPILVSQMRASGLGATDAERLVKEALSVATTTLDDPQARWVLDNHASAASETSWTGVLGNEIHTVKPDRVFQAGDAPETEGTDFWIVDYKTAILAEADDPAKVAKLRAVFAPQLDVYTRMLRQLHGASIKVNVGIYFPGMKFLDWWSVGTF